MSLFSFLGICVAIGFAVAWSLVLLRQVWRQKKLTWRDFKAWMKNVMDSLFGMG